MVIVRFWECFLSLAVRILVDGSSDPSPLVSNGGGWRRKDPFGVFSREKTRFQTSKHLGI